MTIDLKGKAVSPALADMIAAAGHSLRLHDNVPVADDEAAVQAIIDGFSGADAAVPVLALIKTRAREVIVARYPDWKQANMTARAVELTRVMAGGRELSPSESAELAALETAWAWIKSVRTASDTHEAALMALAAEDDFAGVVGYDSGAGWPA